MATTTLPVILPVTIYTGTTFRRVFRWLPDGATPQDFTGWSADLWVGVPGRTPMVAVGVGGGLTLSSVGEVIIELSAAQTVAMKPGVYQYNLDLTDGAGTITRFLRGRLLVEQDPGPGPGPGPEPA